MRSTHTIMGIGRTLMLGMVDRSFAPRGTAGGVVSCHVHSSQPMVASSGSGHVLGMDGGGGGGGAAGGGAASNTSGSTSGSASQPQASGCRTSRSGMRRRRCAGHRQVCLAMMRSEMPWVPPECACMTVVRWQPAGRCTNRLLCQQRRWPRPRRGFPNTCMYPMRPCSQTSPDARTTHVPANHECCLGGRNDASGLAADALPRSSTCSSACTNH